MQTVIRSARQDAIEPNKPRFQFWFADEPQFAAYELRGLTSSRPAARRPVH